MHCRVYKSILSIGCVTSLASDENKIITGGTNKVVKITDLVTGKCINSLKGHMDTITAIQYDDSKILTSSLDHTVKVWDFSLSGVYQPRSCDTKKCTIS